ncbi:MAG TPA: adenosylcobinamide-GDP ribazoletransferase [Burkholderiales bacterium]|nr:adenosylcobinamide-GDP ribazoletransferase [Burkholderiales bacterium]
MFAREIRLFFTAWTFFTRVPLPAALAGWVGYSEDLMNRAARYFPLVGLWVGLVAAAVFTFAMWLFTPLVAVALAMVATVLMTGAFHEDGFADVCDGFGGASDPARVLVIMKDPRVGAFGAIGIALMLLTKFAALLSLAEGTDIELCAWILLLGHTLSRAAPVALIRWLDYVRPEPDAKSKPMAQAVSLPGLIVALFWGMVPLGGVVYEYENGWLLVAGVIPVALATLALGLWFRRRISGYTGDCLGATQQVAEVVFYLYAVAVLAPPPSGSV